MKTPNRFLGFLLVLFTVSAALADGFIIVHEPYPIIPPGPRPPRPPWPPQPRSYAFAPLEVTQHQVQVKITDQVALTTVDQEFFNPNDRSLEGTYLFPVPTGAHIDKFSLEIGGKMVEAELLPANKARQIYEDIVRSMKDPALLEYAGRDVFKVRIFPLEPHRAKRVKVSYSQVLKADNGLVRYLYPLNTEKFSAKPIKNVGLKVEIQSSQPLKTIYSPSHAVEVKRQGEKRATVGFEARETKPDTDFQLFYGLEKGDIGASLITYRTGQEDGFFLLLAAPGVDLKPEQVVAKDVLFVLDTSGSMAGKKLDQAKKALRFCVENLREEDHFQIIRFSTETESLFDALEPVDQDHRRRAEKFVENLRPIGGTAIDDALRQALKMHTSGSARPFVVIFLTDGLPTIGVTDENQILAHVRDLNRGESGRSIRVFCFGIGNDVNTHLLDKVAETTQGSSQYVLPDEDLELKLSVFFAKINEPALTDVRLAGPDGVRMFKIHPSPLPDLFKGDQLVALGRYSGRAKGKLTLSGSVNGKDRRFEYDVEFPDQAQDLDFVPRLWATRRVGFLMDEIRLRGENAELREEVTELARQYGIVTPYTAYLIVEDEKQKNIPLSSQSLPQLRDDKAGLDLVRSAYQDSSTSRSGGGAVARARYGLAMKSAAAPATAMDQGNIEARRSLAFSAPAGVAGSRPMPETVDRVIGYGRQTQFVAGKTFYQNGEKWIDAQAQKQTAAPQIRIQFNSQEYFDLLAKWPRLAPWLALGNQVRFYFQGAVYEVFE